MEFNKALNAAQKNYTLHVLMDHINISLHTIVRINLQALYSIYEIFNTDCMVDDIFRECLSVCPLKHPLWLKSIWFAGH